MGTLLIVPLYFPERTPIEIYGEVEDLFDRIVVFDNTPADRSTPRRTEQLDDKTVLIRNGVNVGLAEAYNFCIKTQNIKSDDVIMLLDQDTVITSHSALKRYLDSYALSPGNKAIVGFRGRRLWKKHQVSKNTEAAWVINSGMLFTGKIWQEIGGFDQSFFVDDVDHEFCLRAKDLGISTSIALTDAFEHEIGTPKVYRMFKPFDGMSFKSSDHPPWRRYFWARNRTILLVRHRSIFAILLFGSIVSALLITLIFGEQKHATLSATARGFLQSFSAQKRKRYT